jgi:hypothetical protein
MAASREDARAAKDSVYRKFKQIGSQVVGVGITRLGDEYAVKVNLAEPLAPGIEVPTSINGVPIHIEITGAIRPL